EGAMRIGNREYARDNDSYGLTTLNHKHVHVRGSNIELCYVGKSGMERCITLKDRQLAPLIATLSAQRAETLLSFPVNGDLVAVTSGMVNEYLQDLTGEHITAKDFRTWKATSLVARE